MTAREPGAASEIDRLRAITDVTRAFAEATADYERLLDVVVRRSAEVVGDSCALGLVSDDGRWFALETCFDRDPAALATVREVFGAKPASLESPHPLHARVLHKGESVLVPEVDADFIASRLDPADRGAVLALGIRSMLMVPLRAYGRILGALTILRRGENPGTLGERDIALAEALAGHAASALTNARLLAAEREARAEAARAESARRETLEQLRVSEARYRRLIEGTTEAIWMLDAGQRISFANARAAELLGYDAPADLIGLGIDAFLDADESAATAAQFRRRRDGEGGQVEARLRRRDGAPVWVLVESTPFFDAAGRYEGLLAMAMDVTARRAAEEERARLAAIVESCDEAILGKDLDGRITSWNAGAEQLYGYSRAEMLGRPAALLVRPDRPDEEAGLLARVARGERVVHFETERVCRDGATVPVSLSVSPIRDADGKVVGASSIARDLSAQHRAAAASAESARVQQLFFASSPVPIVLFDAVTLEFVAVNDAAMTLYGYGREEFLRLRLTDLRLPTEASTGALVCGEGTEEWRGGATHRRKDGTTLQVEIQSRPHRLDGRAVRMAVFQDVTDKQQLEAQLRQSQKMEAVGRLAGGVAHDFNNLLSVILGYAELAIGDLRPGEPMRDDLGEIKRAAERAAGLTQQLLAFSRQQILAPRVLDLAEVVAGTEKMLRRLVGEDVALTLLAAPGAALCRVDPGQVEQVVMNLVVNARDAMPAGGQLTIETSAIDLDVAYAAEHLDVAAGRYVLLSVTDTGCGIDKATMARIFEPFFTTKEKGKGTGLGLSTVFGIVKQSGGHVWVYSEPGVGTTFKVYLPRVDERAEALPPSAPLASTDHGTETVLLVEDEEAVRNLVRQVLRRGGYHVIDAANAGQALLHCEQFGARIHLLLTDVIMPQMSGRQLAERLAPMRPDMRVLYMSGYTENSIVHHGVLDAGIAYLAKPVTPARLLKKVREVLDAAR
ncbi:MAG: domain S-box protein [Myxococcaceae bacterium]|nr:domain S-box protein [Myxococcaceae bacterium]